MIDFKRTNQVLTWNRDTQVAIYACIQKRVQNTAWIRLSGIGIAVLSGGVALVKAGGVVVESLFKGMVNVFGSPCSQHLKMSKGIKQLLVNTPIALVNMPLIMIIVAINLVVTPIWMAIKPEGCIKSFHEANLYNQKHTLPFWN